MSNVQFFAEALAYHTKGREAVLREQADLEEKKDCGCGCDTDCDCDEKVKESTDLKNDKNSNGIDDKDENKDKMADVKKMNKGVSEAENSDKGSWSSDSGWKKSDGTQKDEFGNDIKTKNMPKRLAKQAVKKSMNEDYAMELIEHAEDLYNMTMDLNAMMEEAGLSLSEAFQTFPQDLDLEEGFETMSPVKRMIAQKRAGLKKKLTTGGYKIQKKKPIGKMPAKK